MWLLAALMLLLSKLIFSDNSTVSSVTVSNVAVNTTALTTVPAVNITALVNTTARVNNSVASPFTPRILMMAPELQEPRDNRTPGMRRFYDDSKFMKVPLRRDTLQTLSPDRHSRASAYPLIPQPIKEMNTPGPRFDASFRAYDASPGYDESRREVTNAQFADFIQRAYTANMQTTTLDPKEQKLNKFRQFLFKNKELLRKFVHFKQVRKSASIMPRAPSDDGDTVWKAAHENINLRMKINSRAPIAQSELKPTTFNPEDPADNSENDEANVYNNPFINNNRHPKKNQNHFNNNNQFQMNPISNNNGPFSNNNIMKNGGFNPKLVSNEDSQRQKNQQAVETAKKNLRFLMLPNNEVPSGEKLDMAPAVGSRVQRLRNKGRVCQRHILVPEGPKYDSSGKIYGRQYNKTDKRDFGSTPSPPFLLPRCCNCCKKSVLGCE